MTLNMHVKANSCQQSVFLVYANGILLTPATWSGGFLVSGGIQPDNNCNATFTIPQQNGYLNLPSGQVQFTVLYDGWIFTNFTQQSDPSSANQIVYIVDDRTSADFSLQTDTTVNQANPLLLSTNTLQANYTLRLTSIYNFQTAYATTPINLSCSIVGYRLNGVRTTPPPAGLTCGFGSLSTPTASATLGGSGFASQTLVVGAAAGYSIASNTTPAQPSRWWIAGGGTTLACIFLLGLPARRRKWQTLLGACVLVIAGLGMNGCGVTAAPGPQQQGYENLNNGGGSSSGQDTNPIPVPAGTYTVLVTATTTTTTTLTHTLPVQVLVGTTN
jgi:trimeric autotransporter adhesin